MLGTRFLDGLPWITFYKNLFIFSFQKPYFFLSYSALIKWCYNNKIGNPYFDATSWRTYNKLAEHHVTVNAHDSKYKKTVTILEFINVQTCFRTTTLYTGIQRTESVIEQQSEIKIIFTQHWRLSKFGKVDKFVLVRKYIHIHMYRKNKFIL